MLLGTRNSEFDDAVPKLHARRSGMIFIPGGTFQMGSDKHFPEEAPAHRVTVDACWMDATPVTNAQFRAFVEATGYVTIAEITPDAKDYPGALPHMLKADRWSSGRRRGRSISTTARNGGQFRFGATWRRPYGHGTCINGLDDLPLFMSPIRMPKPGSRSVDRTLAAAEAPVRTSSAAILSQSLFLPFV